MYVCMHENMYACTHTDIYSLLSIYRTNNNNYVCLVIVTRGLQGVISDCLSKMAAALV